MIKPNNSKGITLITVVIVVILMFILVGVGTNTGIEMYQKSKVDKFISQMQLIQSRVDELVNSNEIEGLGENINSEHKNILTKSYNNEEITNNTEEYFNSFKYFSKGSLKDNLDLENIDTDVLINFSTREVLSIDGIEYKNKTYYTQYLLPNGQKLIDNNQQDRVFDFTQSNIRKTNDGLNCNVLISVPITNGSLSYKEEGESNWQTITTNTEGNKDYSVNITKTGEYSFKLSDNTSQEEELVENIKIVLTNKPKTEDEIQAYDYALGITNWAQTTDQEENECVWLPRFAYNNEENSQIKFIKGNSNIATDNTYVDMENWTVPKIFTNENEELTGIWIKSSDLDDKFEAVSEDIENMEIDLEKVGYAIAYEDINGEIHIPSMRTVLAYEGIIQFIPNSSGIPSQMINPDTGETITINGHSDMIYLDLPMFKDAENLDKYFEISFYVDDIDDNNVQGAAIVNAKNESASLNYPGFVYRIPRTDRVELGGKGGTTGADVSSGSWTRSYSSVEGHRIIIYRENRKLYIKEYQGNREVAFKEVYNFTNFTSYFNVPITIGGSLNNNNVVNQPFRGFRGTLSNIVVKVFE